MIYLWENNYPVLLHHHFLFFVFAIMIITRSSWKDHFLLFFLQRKKVSQNPMVNHITPWVNDSENSQFKLAQCGDL